MEIGGCLKVLKYQEPAMTWFWWFSNTRKQPVLRFWKFLKYPEPAVLLTKQRTAQFWYGYSCEEDVWGIGFEKKLNPN
jgi:hypothetical protein